MAVVLAIIYALICFAVDHARLSTSAGQINVEQHDVMKKTASHESNFYMRASNNCACVDYNCGCCAHLQERIIHLNNTICANATYLKKDYGFSMTVTFDTYTIFNETLSLRNPPPVCIGAPYVKEWAEVCVRLYDIKASKAHLHACVEVDAKFKHIQVAKYEIGCFDMKSEQLRMAILQLENQVL